MKLWRQLLVIGAASLAALPAQAQNRVDEDRADPATIEQDARDDAQRPARPQQGISVPASRPPGAAPAPAISVGAISVVGTRALPAAAFASAIQSYVGRPLERSDLVRLAGDVAAVARARGYGLATAWIPAQDVADGVLVVEVEEGRIDAVEASGPAADQVEQRLAGVVGDRPVRTSELERALLLAGDVPGLWVGEARLVRRAGRNVLTVATRLQRVSGRATLDNWGTDTIGPVRARVGVDFNSLLLRGDQLSVGGGVTPFEPGELQIVDLRYRLPVGRAGTMIGVGGYVGRTRSGGDLRDRDLGGDSSEFDLDLTHPLARTRAGSLWLNGRLALRNSELDEAGRPIRDDRLVTASAGLYATGRPLGGRGRGRLTGVQGLDLLGATARGDPLASRRDAGGVFTKLEAWADWVRPLGSGFSLELATRAQISNRPLLSSEEIGLGGRQFLRAFDYREASGDEGAAGSAELRFDLRDLPSPARRAQFYAYLDGGRVRDIGTGRGFEELASAGGGVRLFLRHGFEAGVEVGVPLTRGLFDREPDPRVSFSLSADF